MGAPDMTGDRLAGTWHIVCSSFPTRRGGAGARTRRPPARRCPTAAGTDVVIRSDRLTDPQVLTAVLAVGERHGAPRLPGFAPAV